MQSQQVNEFVRGGTVLFAAFVGIGVNLTSMVYYSSGIWVRPWQDEFGWTRAEIGAQQSISVIVMMLLATFAGQLIDKYGLKKVTTISLAGYGFLLLGFTQMSGPIWQLYVLSALFAIFGVASTSLAFTRAVNAFFVKHRGLALGISLTSTGVMAYAMPKFMTPFVAENGWRAGYVVMFLIVMASLPIVYFLIKDTPDDAAEADGPTQAQEGVSLKEAIRSSVFWRVAGIFFLISVAILGLIPAYIPMLQDAGMTPQQAGGLAAILGLSVMVGRLLIGFVIDRVFAPYVTAAVFALVGMGCLLLGMGGIGYAMVAAIALGFAVGAEVDLIGYYTARYFGMAHYGSVYGLQYSIFIFGAGVSPIYTGYIWDVTGNYDIALIMAAVLMLPVVALALSLPKFERD
ncbi:MAG: MFS transporter [Parvibaculales bacterium]